VLVPSTDDASINMKDRRVTGDTTVTAIRVTTNVAAEVKVAAAESTDPLGTGLIHSVFLRGVLRVGRLTRMSSDVAGACCKRILNDIVAAPPSASE
jgi:hypothetical protein